MNRAFLGGAIGLAVACGGVGCASWWSADDDKPQLTHEQRCTSLLRDLRLYCKDGLRDRNASVGAECLSRRLELRKLCVVK